MKFKDILQKKEDLMELELPKTSIIKVADTELLEKTVTPEEILRGAKIKIKMVTPTSFGTQIDFAKKYDDAEIEELLKNFVTKIKGKSVFIVD